MPIVPTRRLFFATLLALAAAPASGDWPPLDPRELASTTPTVEKDADAEVLSWEVKIDDTTVQVAPESRREHFLRIKIFTERGRDLAGRVDLTAGGRTSIHGIEGRTVRPDGTVVPLRDEDVFERQAYRRRGVKWTVKSFALPAAQPGSIVDLRWRETLAEQIAHYHMLPLQRDIPVRKIKYSIHPISWPGWRMKAQTFNATLQPFRTEGRFQSVTLENVPAFREEPFMPPRTVTRSAMLIFYEYEGIDSPEKFWKDFAKNLQRDWPGKVGDEVKAAAREAVGEATDDADRMTRLVRYCRTNIRRTQDDAAVRLEKEEDDRGERSPAAILARRSGTDRDIRRVFAALAMSLGYEVRPTATVDRRESFFDPSFMNDYFLWERFVAVRLGTEWRVYDPCATYLPPDMLPWWNEGLRAVLADSGKPSFVDLPVSGPERSPIRREGRFRLAADGTLEGDVTVEYAGHAAAVRKESYDTLSEEKRADTYEAAIKRALPGAEITKLSLDGVTDPLVPMGVTFHVRVPGYALKAGRRLFLAPAFFQKGTPPLLSAATRVHALCFEYPWTEEDRVSIELPAGYELEAPQAPAGAGGGPIAEYGVQIRLNKTTNTLECERKLRFGGGNRLLFKPAEYGAVKAFFDAVHVGDAHTLIARPAAVPAATP